jgi:hypothetical protein
VAFGGPHAVFAVDLNRFNSVNVVSQDPVTNQFTTTSGAVIPVCANAAERADINAQCSTGTIPVYHSAASSKYMGLHLRLDKRFSDNYQLTVSYALSRYNAHNGIIDQIDGWHDSYGPDAADRKHKLNISGIW